MDLLNTYDGIQEKFNQNFLAVKKATGKCVHWT